MLKVLLKGVGFLEILLMINGLLYRRLISDICMMSQMVFPIQFKLKVGMYSFTGQFCHEHRFYIRWWRGIWFVIWVVLAFFIYEVVRAILVWLYVWLMRRREGRIRLPADELDLQ
jgi:hypothetical protein